MRVIRSVVLVGLIVGVAYGSLVAQVAILLLFVILDARRESQLRDVRDYVDTRGSLASVYRRHEEQP